MKTMCLGFPFPVLVTQAMIKMMMMGHPPDLHYLALIMEEEAIRGEAQTAAMGATVAIWDIMAGDHGPRDEITKSFNTTSPLEHQYATSLL